MAWLRVSVETPRSRTDATEERLREAGAVAVSLVPADVGEAVVEPAPSAQPLWEAVRVEGLLPVDADLAGLGGLQAEADFVADRDWSETWRRDFGPMRFGRLRVVPKDHPGNADDGAVVRLDPGLAFGSGAHPSTALCLGWLGAHRLTRKRILDVGCGSGILGIAAARLGAAEVVAVDHDPQARQATSANARENDVRLTVLGDLAEAQGYFDIALANIVADTLCAMSPTLAECAGTLVLSGILEGAQAQAVADSCPDMRFAASETLDGWALLVGTRNA